MKKQYWVLLCYRERRKPLSKIYEVQIQAHSIQDAKIKQQFYWIRTHCTKDYVILAGAKLDEVGE